MKMETKRVLTLTKEEQKTIRDLYEILDKDNSLDTGAVWDILTDICEKNDYSADYGYTINIVD